MKLSVSFLSIKDEKEKIEKLNETSCDYIHYDIMDGIFTENKSSSYEEMANLNITKPKDVHLMVEDVKSYVGKFKNLNPEFITFHLEADINHKEMIDYIHSLNIKVGMSINPETDIQKIVPYLPYLDLVLIMSVPPGKGGQTFINIQDKINELKTLININKYSCLIEVDGGINDETITYCQKADIIVVGSYITSGDYRERIDNLWAKKDLH